MKKETYLERLEKLLEGMDPKEKDEALAYCREYFEEARDKDLEQIIKELGTPEEFAEQLKNDESFKQKITPPEFKHQMENESNEISKNQKKKSNLPIIIIGAIAAFIIIGLVLRFVLGFYSFHVANKVMIGKNTQDFTSEKTSAADYTFPQLNNIELETNCKVLIRKGNSNKIMFNEIYDNEVNVNSKGNRVDVKVDSNHDAVNKKVIIEVADGNINIDIECESGDVTIEELAGNNLEVSCDNGNIEVKSANFNLVSLESSNGNIDAQLSGKFEDYRYELENENGNTNVGNISNIGTIETEGNINGSRKLSLEASNGNIAVSFIN